MEDSHSRTWDYRFTFWRISNNKARPSWGRRERLQGKTGMKFEVDGWGNATLNLLFVLAHLNRNTTIERDCFQLTIQLFTRNKIKKIRLKHHELFPRSYFNYSSRFPTGPWARFHIAEEKTNSSSDPSLNSTNSPFLDGCVDECSSK